MPRKEPTRGFHYAAKRPTVDEFLSVGARINRTTTDFLKVDLETALTFSGIALQSSGDLQKRQRNQQHARRGYDTIVRLITKVVLSEKDAKFMKRNLRRLKRELQKLGEAF